MNLQTIPISQINPAPYNPRKNLKPSDPEYKKLKKSISEFGLVEPLVWNEKTGNLVGGHQRLKILQERGDSDVEVSVVCLDDAAEKALNLALNKISGEWDDLKLSQLLGELSSLPDFDVELTGFDVDEIARLNPAEVVEDDFDVDKAIEEIDEPVTKYGDIILLGRHRLMCGDSTKEEDVAKLMDGKKADIVFADPPYGVDIVQGNKKHGKVGGGGPTKFKTGTDGAGKIVPAKEYRVIEGDETTDTAKKFYNLCKSMDLKNIVLWGGNYFTDFLPPSRCWFVWDKEMTGNFSEAEMAWTTFDKGGIRVFKYLWNGLSREGDRRLELKARVHPTQKPVGLFIMILQRFDYLNTVFDGFLGSGSTTIAAEQTNRICYGMELDPKYCDVIIRRWEEFTSQKAKRL